MIRWEVVTDFAISQRKQAADRQDFGRAYCPKMPACPLTVPAGSREIVNDIDIASLNDPEQIPHRPNPFPARLAAGLMPALAFAAAVPVERFGGGGLSSLQQHLEPGRHRARLQGCRGLDHRGLVERVLAKLRDAAARHARRAVLLYLCARLRPRRRVVGTGLHVLARQGIHHQGHRELPGARLRPHRLLRGRHRRAARLDRAADRIQRTAARAAGAGHSRNGRSRVGPGNLPGTRPACPTRRAGRLRARLVCRQPQRPEPSHETSAPHQDPRNAWPCLLRQRDDPPPVRGRRRRVPHQYEPHLARQDARAGQDHSQCREQLRPADRHSGRPAGPEASSGLLRRRLDPAQQRRELCARFRQDAGRQDPRPASASGNSRRAAGRATRCCSTTARCA